MILSHLLAGALLAAPAAQSTSTVASALEAQLAIEERLLTADQAAYRELGEKLRTARRSLEEAEANLDTALRLASPDIDEIDRLDRSRRAARAAADLLDQEAELLRAQLRERLRRRVELRAAIQQSKRGDPRDPLSGDWTLTLVSPPTSGTMSLRLDGVLLAGNYALEDGRTGSLRGTFVNGRVRLERVDSKAGFEGTFDGTLDAALGELRGAWTPNELADGGPGVSAWSARRAPLARGTRRP